MENLLSLAERCEKATGPDRELDVAIGLTGRFYIAEPRYPGAEPMIGYVDADGSRVEPGNGAQDSLVPHYTASLDAAMTLAKRVGQAWCRPHNLVIATAYGSAYIVPNDGESYGVSDPLRGDAYANGDNEADRTARAITAACLRALARAPVNGMTTNPYPIPEGE